MWSAPGNRVLSGMDAALRAMVALLAAVAFLAALMAMSAGTPSAVAATGAGAAGDATSGSADDVSGTAPGTPQEARWVKKKINFTYQGFTTRYSCQGLRDKVRDVLLQLGARKSDLNVHEIGCTTNIGRPDPFPTVGGTFFVLEPASSSTEHAVHAEWQTVNVRVGTPGLDTAGQCELVEQVRQKILPLFTTRDVKLKQNCIPHQLTPSGSSLSVEVLKPAPHA